MGFALEICEFLRDIDIRFNFYEDSVYAIEIAEFKLLLDLVSLDMYSSDTREIKSHYRVVKIYEDQWITKNRLLKGRLGALFGRCDRIFARECIVSDISIENIRSFLNENHLLGYAKAKYRYALYGKSNGLLYAVALFSKPRVIDREGVSVNSYEWVRYAALSDCSVVGGMGRLMMAHIRNRELDDKPSEIMSYADKEWSYGDSYMRLNFSLIGESSPENFIIDPTSMQRVSVKRMQRDLSCNTHEITELLKNRDAITLRNQGNLKFVRRFFI